MVWPSGRARRRRSLDRGRAERCILVNTRSVLLKETDMRLDIRTPIGIMFALLGGLLTAYGVFADKAIYVRSLGVNVNLWWGLVMLVFGILMLLLGRRGTSKVHLTEDSPEGRKVEEREHRM